MKRRLRTFQVMLACEPVAEYSAFTVDRSAVAASIARSVIDRQGDWDREQFLVLALNARSRVSGYKIVSSGTATSCLVHPREVFQAALALSAVRLIVAHNHPSGDTGPSVEDIALTQRLRACGELIGIPVIDSLVVTHADFASVLVAGSH